MLWHQTSLALWLLPLGLIIAGYFLGSLLPADAFFRLFKRKTPQELGEKPGTFAVLKQVGIIPAILCLAYDGAKGFLPAFFALQWDVNLLWLPFIALAPVIGHNWPFLRWDKGGWGLAAIAGVLFGLGGWLTAAGLLGIPFGLIFRKSRGVAIGLVGFPLVLLMFILNKKPWQVIVAALSVMLLGAFRRLTGERKEKQEKASA